MDGSPVTILRFASDITIALLILGRILGRSIVFPDAHLSHYISATLEQHLVWQLAQLTLTSMEISSPNNVYGLVLLPMGK